MSGSSIIGTVGTPLITKATSTGPFAATQNLWTYVGGIEEVKIVEIVRTAIQAQACNMRAFIQNDSLGANAICANTSLNALAVGTLLHQRTPGTAFDTHVDGADTNQNATTEPITTICTTSGLIYMTFSADNTGVIDWYLQWTKATPDGQVFAVGSGSV